LVRSTGDAIHVFTSPVAGTVVAAESTTVEVTGLVVAGTLAVAGTLVAGRGVVEGVEVDAVDVRAPPHPATSMVATTQPAIDVRWAMSYSSRDALTLAIAKVTDTLADANLLTGRCHLGARSP
jgi:hypothetical protein